MKFYQVLSQYYDQIFPIKQPQRNFLHNFLQTNGLSSVLDVGCGTGTYALELAQSGIRAVGIDLSREMIEIAVSRARESASDAKFVVADMLDLSALPQGFDLVLCMGNTLAHLRGERDIHQALRQFSQQGRYLIIQVVNYDRILQRKVTGLPEIRTENLSFRRSYRHLEDGYIDFSMEINLLAEGTTLSAVNRLFPVTRARLATALAAAGWVTAGWYGSFAGEPWTEDSPATVVTAKVTG